MGLLRERRPREALSLLASLPAEASDDSRLLARRAYAHALAGDIGPALADAGAVLADAGAGALGLNLAGNAFTLCHRPETAHAAFERAARLEPASAQAQANLAAAARFLGRLEEAEAAYDRVIAADPAAWAAWRDRSELRRQTPDRNHIADLERVLAGAGPPAAGRVQLLYALGKEQEDLGGYERAFAAFDQGAKLRRAHMRYDAAEDIAGLEHIARIFDAAACAPGDAGSAGADAPIFILGLPRAGSTLLEQMLGRHSQVQALGELQAFGAAVVGAVRARPGQPPSSKPEMIAASASVPPARIGEAYLAAVQPLRDKRPRFIDKLPFNFLYVGLIARALPGARIVHLTREPADACVAIYKTLFEEAYPWSYDLAELGRYHNAYRRLMAHWRAALGPRLIEVAYEDLVGDPSAAMADLMPKLDLNLEPACLAPEASAGAVMTASAAQVRAPIHTRSVGLWRHYAPYLDPLLAVLDV